MLQGHQHKEDVSSLNGDTIVGIQVPANETVIYHCTSNVSVTFGAVIRDTEAQREPGWSLQLFEESAAGPGYECLSLCKIAVLFFLLSL